VTWLPWAAQRNPSAGPAPPGPIAADQFTVADVAIWAAFAVDYVARLYLAPARWRFVRSHLLDLLVLVVPFLRPLRALRLLRIARLGVVAGVASSSRSVTSVQGGAPAR